jgi:hypothetical protein
MIGGIVPMIAIEVTIDPAAMIAHGIMIVREVMIEQGGTTGAIIGAVTARIAGLHIVAVTEVVARGVCIATENRQRSDSEATSSDLRVDSVEMFATRQFMLG